MPKLNRNSSIARTYLILLIFAILNILAYLANWRHCSLIQSLDKENFGKRTIVDQLDIPVVYVITATHERPTQLLDLTRLMNTLRLVPNAFWILVEDRGTKSRRVTSLLQRSGLSYIHRATQEPLDERMCFRGCPQRNLGLEILSNSKPSNSSIVYIADDDNAYDTRLFDELRKTKFLSTFPVAFVGKSRYQRCVVDEFSGKVSGFATQWTFKRKFQVDMAGFAFSVKALLDKKPRFSRNTKCGWIENDFIAQMISSPRYMEPLCNNCTQVLVWHVKTASPEGKGMQPWNYDSIPRLYGGPINDPLFDTIDV